MLEGLKESAVELKDDSEKRGHFGGQTAVSVITMMSGAGFIGKFGKADELMGVCGKTSKIVDDAPNPNLYKNLDEIKKSERNVTSEAELKKFVDESGGNEVLEEIADDIPNVYKKGEDFTVLKNARNLPGTSGGNGKVINGKWLKGTDGNAGLFPKSVADKLKGKSYANFDEFRKDFWKAVADDPDLAKQFSASDITRMNEGLSPYTRVSQQVGGQKNYVLHHKTPINQGGGVYDMDNLYIVTPRFHKEILDPKYHYGYGY